MNDGAPRWLGDLRERVLESPAWRQIERRIELRVRQELERRGLGQWEELAPEEKDIVLNGVREEVCSEAAFAQFALRLGGAIDDELLLQENLAHAAEQEQLHAHLTALPERMPQRTPDMLRLLDIAGEAAAGLLRRAPDMLHMLRLAVGCRRLPTRLRQEVWELQLRDVSARLEYLALAAQDRLSVLSKRDAEVVKSCRLLLDQEFDDGSLGELLLPCKTIVSYFHRRHGGRCSFCLPYLVQKYTY